LPDDERLLVFFWVPLLAEPRFFVDELRDGACAELLRPLLLLRLLLLALLAMMTP
jgi:hypothetical protein